MDEILSNGKRGGHRLRQYYARYTLVFAAVAVLAFSVYIFTGRTLIWNADAWSQHYKALVYYAEYLRSIVKTLFTEGRLVIPNWDFAFGEGGDVLTTLHYYVIGDPLTALSVFVPSRYLHILYDALSIFRMYLAGAVFSYFCFFTGIKNMRAVMVGSLTYAFSYWAIVNAGRHPYFLNPMIYFPLILIGVELIITGRRPYLFIVSVAIAAISNFYFFYMIAIITALYVVCRLIYAVRREKAAGTGVLWNSGEAAGKLDVRSALKAFLRIAGGAVLGVIMSAVVLLPMCMAFLGDSRADVDYDVGLFYPLIYYTKLPGLIAGEGGGDYWICTGFSVLTFPAFLMMFRDKKYGLLRFFAVLSMAALCLPIFGHVLNGFSYVTNRWCWAFAAVAGYVVAVYWEKLMHLSIRDYVIICVGEGIILILCLIFNESRTVGALSALALAFVMLILLLPVVKKDCAAFLSPITCERAAVLLSCASMVLNSLSFTAPWGYDYASEHIERAGIYNRLYNNETARIKAIAAAEGKDGTFFRYSGPSMAQNAGAVTGLSSTQYFWSLSNPSVTERNVELGLNDYWIFRYSGEDGRTAMNTLSSVRYYVVAHSSRAPIPYGYEPVESELANGYLIYENKNALPLAYSYDTVITKDVWDTLSASEKEEAMLYGVYVGDADKCALDTMSLDDAGDVITDEELSFNVRKDSEGNVIYEDGKFIVATPNSKVTLIADRKDTSELYMSFTGFSFKGTPEYDLYRGGEDVDPENVYGEEEWASLSFSEKVQKWVDKVFWKEPSGVTLKIGAGYTSNTLTWYGNGYQFYNGRQDFTVNLGYHSRGITLMTIIFPRAGIYAFDEMKLTARDVSRFGDAAAELSEDTLDDMVIGADTVSGSVSLAEPKFMLFSIPYSEGWRAYVDGKEAELCRANISYMGLLLEPGEHEIELRYDTPYLRAGVYITAVGTAVFAVTVAVTEFSRRSERRRNREVA